MNKILLIAVSLSFGLSAFANTEEVKKMKTLEKARKGAKIAAPEFPTEVKAASGIDSEKVAKFRARTLPPAKRDAAFRAAGVDGIVASWSEYDKDMLIVRAKEFSPDKFAKSYPEWDAATCAKMQAAVR